MADNRRTCILICFLWGMGGLCAIRCYFVIILDTVFVRVSLCIWLLSLGGGGGFVICVCRRAGGLMCAGGFSCRVVSLLDVCFFCGVNAAVCAQVLSSSIGWEAFGQSELR